MLKVKLLKSFNTQLKEICNYIAEDNPSKAEEIYLSVLEYINLLKFFPLMGRKVSKDYRELIIPKYKYKVVYKVCKSKVCVVAIRREQDIFNF